jgi:predicted amidohydrolase
VDHALRHHATRPAMLLLGSFHEECSGGLFNCARLLDGFTGLPIFEHRKLRPFGSYGQGNGPDRAEAILPGTGLTLLVTALGNWTALICKDFVDADASVRQLPQVLAADWLLVPSYGNEVTHQAQLRRAREVAFVETGGHVVVASQRDLGLSSGAALPGFCHRSGEPGPESVGIHGGLVKLPIGTPWEPWNSDA